jgi:5'-nucleotidase
VHKIGIIGLGEIEWLETLCCFEVSDVDYEDFRESAIKLNKKLREESGCDMVIALTHMRVPNDKFLAKAAGVDMILGGHDHTYEHYNIDNKLLLKSGTDFRDLSRIEIVFFNEINGNLKS